MARIMNWRIATAPSLEWQAQMYSVAQYAESWPMPDGSMYEADVTILYDYATGSFHRLTVAADGRSSWANTQAARVSITCG